MGEPGDKTPARCTRWRNRARASAEGTELVAEVCSLEFGHEGACSWRVDVEEKRASGCHRVPERGDILAKRAPDSSR